MRINHENLLICDSGMDTRMFVFEDFNKFACPAAHLVDRPTRQYPCQ
jgi:hypothetical protein